MRASIAAFLASVASSACAPEYSHLDLEILNRSAGLSGANGHLSLPQSRAVGVEARPVAAGATAFDEDAVVELSSSDDGVLLVFEGVERHVFVLYGVALGETTLEASFDGDRVEAIEFHVTAD